MEFSIKCIYGLLNVYLADQVEAAFIYPASCAQQIHFYCKSESDVKVLQPWL